MPAYAGSPGAKSSKVCGIVKKSSSKDKKRTLCAHLAEMSFNLAMLNLLRAHLSFFL